MEKRNLDINIKGIIEKARERLISNIIKDPNLGFRHFTDYEKQDLGVFKDIDGINALLEPFLLCPVDFVDTKMSINEIDVFVEDILKQIEDDAELDLSIYKPFKKKNYYGFSSVPYPSFYNAKIDFVDAASSIIRLICNLVEVHKILKKTLKQTLEIKIKNIFLYACEFLIEAKIEDEKGIRWMGLCQENEMSKNFATLYFTNAASLSLKNAIENNLTNKWLDEKQKSDIEILLAKVPLWVMAQYKENMKSFSMEGGKPIYFPIGVFYALEILYTLKSNMDSKIKNVCRDALNTLMDSMTTVEKANELQVGFFHSVPFAGATSAYDDRGYIGSFLSLFALAKREDPEIVTEKFNVAAKVMYNGVGGEWIDESNLWDDGVPLICYSLSAMIGLINYSLYVKSDEIKFLDHELKRALKEVLTSDEMIEAIASSLIEKSKENAENEIDSLIKQKIK